MSSRDYHLRELEIARSPEDPRYVMPAVLPRHRRILDVGCGAGQTLIASRLDPGVEAHGIDVDLEALLLGRELTRAVAFAAGRAEALPYAGGVFDLVIARVALPLTYVPAAVAELGRVLYGGGDVWLVLHPLSRTLKNLGESLRHLRLKHAAYRSYVLANGTLFHATGRLVPSPLDGHYESFQTDGAIRRELARAGFGEIRIQRGQHLVVTATKL